MRGVLFALIASVVWSLSTLWFTHQEGMFFPAQMRERFPHYPKGLPAVAHGGLMDDPLLFSLIVAYIVGMHGQEWTINQITILGGIGLIGSIAMHYSYKLTPFPDPIAWTLVGFTHPAGWSHLFYMAAGLTVVGLGYFCSRLHMAEAILLSLGLLIHVVIGTHLLLGWLNTVYMWEWCPEFLQNKTAWVTCSGVCALLIGMSWYAAGGYAAVGFATLVGMGVFIIWCTQIRVQRL